MGDLYYLIRSKLEGTKEYDGKDYTYETELSTHDKSIAVAQAKELKQCKEILSITLYERLYGYEDRIIYEFERE